MRLIDFAGIANGVPEVASAHRSFFPWDSGDLISVSNVYGIQVAAGDRLVYTPYIRTSNGADIGITMKEISLEARYIRED